MNKKLPNLTTPLIAVAFVAIAIFVFQNRFVSSELGQTQTPEPPTAERGENATANLTNLSFEYGTLVYVPEQELYYFTVGDLQIPQNNGTRLDNLIRLLGGKTSRRQPNFGLLLNTIGAQGWELIESGSDSKSTTWLFKRAY